MQGLLNRIIAAAQTRSVTPAVFDGLVAQSKTYVQELFGRDSWQLKHIESQSMLTSYTDVDPDKLAEKLFAVAHSIAGMSIGLREAATARAEANRMAGHQITFDPEKIFIVHGHDHAALENVVAFVRDNQLNPVVMKDEPNSGQTLLEKFLSNSQVGFAIILLTPDDLGGAKSQTDQLTRARQNVILELGYFIGAIGRNRVAVLYVEGVELPSDILGLAYISYDEHGIWKQGLKLELEAAGYS